MLTTVYKQYTIKIGVYYIMSFFLFVCLTCSIISFGKEVKLSPTEIRNKVAFIQKNSIFSDSLDFVDSTCSYFILGMPYSGYVIHYVDNQYRFNLFEEGKYYGEEWVFDSTTNVFDSDSLINKLKEFRIRCNKNDYFMVVTTYFDFKTNSIHEIYIDNCYECASTVTSNTESFDAIFGGINYHDLPYQSFYQNGNKKEVSVGHPYTEGKMIRFYENGKNEYYHKSHKNGENSYIKEFDEEGNCTKRLKSRNNKIRGFYLVMGGQFSFSFIARRQLKKQEKQKKRTD